MKFHFKIRTGDLIIYNYIIQIRDNEATSFQDQIQILFHKMSRLFLTHACIVEMIRGKPNKSKMLR